LTRWTKKGTYKRYFLRLEIFAIWSVNGCKVYSAFPILHHICGYICCRISLSAKFRKVIAPQKIPVIQWLIDWSFIVYMPLNNFSLIWRRHHCRWRAAKFRPLLGAQVLWAGRDLYSDTPTATRGIGFSCLIRRTAPFWSPLTTHEGMWRTYSNPDPHSVFHIYDNLKQFIIYLCLLCTLLADVCTTVW
jgi:hypothetical protein